MCDSHTEDRLNEETYGCDVCAHVYTDDMSTFPYRMSMGVREDATHGVQPVTSVIDENMYEHYKFVFVGICFYYNSLSFYDGYDR